MRFTQRIYTRGLLDVVVCMLGFFSFIIYFIFKSLNDFYFAIIYLKLQLKPVLRGHLWNKEKKRSSKAGGLVKEV